MSDWMHDTARCLGDPLDSSRAARERARETSCGRHPRRAGQAQPGWILPPLPSPLASTATLPACAASPLARVACPSLRSSPVWLTSLTWPARAASTLACAASLLARVASLSHLAGGGQCSLAIGHGCLVRLLVGVLDRRPVSPLPSTSACSGAGSGWHGCGWIAVSAVYSEGLSPVAPAFARARSAGPSPCGGSPASRGFAGLGNTGLSAVCQPACTSADAFSAKLAVSPNWVPWGPGQVGSKDEPGAALGGHGQVTNQSATGSLTRGRWRRRRMRCWLPPKRLGCRGPGRRADLDSE
jgi:hypothetical protein